MHVLYETFWDFISSITKLHYDDYVDQIWHKTCMITTGQIFSRCNVCSWKFKFASHPRLEINNTIGHAQAPVGSSWRVWKFVRTSLCEKETRTTFDCWTPSKWTVTHAVTLLLPEHYQLYPRVRNQINEFAFSLPSLNRWNKFVILVRAKLTVQRLTCRLATRGLAVIGPLAVFFLLTSCQFDSCSTGCFANFYASTNSRVSGSLVGPICRYFSPALEFFERYRSGSSKVCFPISWFVRKFNAVVR